MVKKKINVFFGNNGKIQIELETKSFLSDIRKELLDKIIFPFIFLNEDDEEIPKEKENSLKLEDILVGKYLFLKKEKIKRVMLGRKVESFKGLDFYVYPQINLTNEQKEYSSNIMVIGETGVGKSTWLHSFINYLQNIQLEENNRYYLFDEKSLQEEYQKKHLNEPTQIGSRVTDEPVIYNIEATKVFNNPIRLIDTKGFGDLRGPRYDEKITKDIQNLFEGSEIENLNAVCLVFKATNTRSTDRLKMVMNKIFSLFGKEIKNNIVIIFTFCDSFKEIKGVEVLKDKGGPFYEVLGDIEKIPYFGFNNLAYFTNDKENFEKVYENNAKSFGSLLKYIFSLKRISLESSKKVIQYRMHIKNNIINLCDKLNYIIFAIDEATQNQIRLLKLTNELEKNAAGEVNQIPYTNSKQVEKYKKEQRDFIYKQLEEGNRQMLEINKEIHNSLREGIDCLYQLALKNNELNKLALKKDKEKYGFTKEILKENLEDKAKSKLFDLFINALDNIEKLCESNKSKEETINLFKSLLLSKREN